MESHANTPPDPMSPFVKSLRERRPSIDLALRFRMLYGLRPSELLRLNGPSVDVQAWTVIIPSRKRTTTPTRVVTVSPAMASELRRYCDALRRERRPH